MHPFEIVFKNYFVDDWAESGTDDGRVERHKSLVIRRFYLHAYLYKLGVYIIRHNTEHERLVIQAKGL